MKQNNTKKIKYTLICFLFAVFMSYSQKASFALSAEPSSAFNLITVVDNFLNIEDETNSTFVELDEKSRQKKEFMETTRRFNQGNVSVAYNDYSKLISEMNNDIALFVISKSMYEIGFFSLGDLALSKIAGQSFFTKQIADLKKSYQNSYTIDKTEEIYLAKAYTSIYFDSSPEEVAFDLNKKTGLIEKSDYANYVLSQALYESRQYQQALMFIDYALKKNPNNLNYLCYKVKILYQAKKYKDALKIVQKLEYTNTLTPELKNKVLVLKENILSVVSDDENDKKFHGIYALYLGGNYYKVISECQNVLNFNKNNYKILTLLAQSQLNVNKITDAQKNLQQSYEINKKYAPTLALFGDIEYINKNYQKSLEYYKKALNFDKNDTASLMKVALIYKNNLKEGNEKNLIKTEKKIKETIKDPFIEYYTIASGILKSDINLRREYLLKSLAINLMYENCWREFLECQTERKRFLAAKNFLYMISFTNNFSYFYYYYSAIMNIEEGKRELALGDLKYCLNLNPLFEPARNKYAQLNTGVSI